MRALTAAMLGTVSLVAFTAATSPALMIAMKPPAQRALSAEVVIVGKVTAVEKDTIEAAPFPNSPQKLQYRVAIVKVESALAGAGNLTHLKVGFIPPPPPQANPAPAPGIRPIPGRRPIMAPDLKVGDEFLFFLVKHPGGFYAMPAMSPPIAMKGDQGKKEVEAVKKVLAVVADPAKALKSGKAQDRYFAAATLVTKYRSYPEIPGGGEIDQQPIDADESKLILHALAEGDWTRFDRESPNGMQAFNQLGLTPQDGFVRPRPVPVKPGQPPVNFNQLTRDAYVKWLEGPGKNYRIKRIVPKSK